jgi:hypothetical protein
VDTLFPKVATGFEVFAALVSAALYLVVAVAAVARAPRDIRTRVFLATAVASAAPYSVTVLLWARGANAAFTMWVIGLVGLSLMFGSLTLLHFTQVFPWRRPWIRSHGKWLIAGYLLTPIAMAVPIWILGPFFADMASLDTTGSGGLGAVSVGMTESLVTLVVVLPALFVVGLVVPFAAVFSLYKSWLLAKAAHQDAARVTTFWILISQMAGGVLTILIVPLLHFVAPVGPWVTITAVLLFATGLLMPLAFAAAVWKYGVLDFNPEIPPV